LPLAGIGSLHALAEGAHHDGPVLAAIDARRGEAYAAIYDRGDIELVPSALTPDRLAQHASQSAGPLLAVGDGALRFRTELEAAGAVVPADDDPVHRVSARQLCRLAAVAATAGTEVLPDYQRLPDAELRQRT
jgi:tRNA threonylcarbamoyladenosine biosynthesis protein TsaB